MSIISSNGCAECVLKRDYFCDKCRRVSWCSQSCYERCHEAHEIQCVKWSDDNATTLRLLHDAYITLSNDKEYRPLLREVFKTIDVLVINYTGDGLDADRAQYIIKTGISIACLRHTKDFTLPLPLDRTMANIHVYTYMLGHMRPREGEPVDMKHAVIGSCIHSHDPSRIMSYVYEQWV